MTTNPFCFNQNDSNITVFGDKRYHLTDYTFHFKNRYNLVLQKVAFVKYYFFIQHITYSYIKNIEFMHRYVTFLHTYVIFLHCNVTSVQRYVILLHFYVTFLHTDDTILHTVVTVLHN